MKSPSLNFSAKSGDQRFDGAADDFALLLVRIAALQLERCYGLSKMSMPSRRS